MTPAAHHALLVAAVAALAFAALRAAAALGARGVLLPVAAAPLAAGAAALTAMALAPLRLGGSAALLAGAALAAGLAAWRLLPPMPGAVRLSAQQRLALGAALGAGAAWVAWLVRRPVLGIDPLTYHLPESVRFVQQGTPGSVEEVVYEFPVGAYPLLNEVLVGWGTAIGRSFAFALLWTPACGALLAMAAWAALRGLGAARAHTALAVAGVLLVPIAATQYHGPNTDLPALAWLAVTFALAVGAGREPRLLALAVLAFGIAIGTKTTVAPLGLAALALGVARARGTGAAGPAGGTTGAATAATAATRGGVPWRAVAIGSLPAAVLGGFWYARNWVQHGSPLWPFPIPFPGSDPVPALLRSIDVSLLGAPGRTLSGDRLPVYFDVLGGAPLLLAGAVVAAAAARRRPVLLAGAATAGAALLWANAPFTGQAPDPVLDFSFTTTRYLLAAVGAGAVTLALAGGRAAAALLALAAAVSLAGALALPSPGVPSLATLAAGALAGAAAAAAVPRVPRRVLAAGGALAAVGALAVCGAGFVARHGGIGRFESAGVVSWLARQPAFASGSAPVASAPGMLAVLAGDRLQHEIALIPRDEPCPAVRERVRRGWVVVRRPRPDRRRVPFTAARCLEAERPVYEDAAYRVYASRQIAIRSSASASGSAATEKSSGVMASAAAGAVRRLRVSSRSYSR